MGGLILIFVILAFIYLYKRREEDEENLILKMIGYYILATFTFTYTSESISIMLPIGFVIYLLFFKPQKNNKLKRHVAILGVIVLCVGFFVPKIEQWNYERPIYLETNTDKNIKGIDLNLEFGYINEKIEENNTFNVKDFLLSYDKEGDIKDLRMSLYGAGDIGEVYYNIQYLKNEGKYLIERKKSSSYDNATYLDVNTFLNGIMQIKDIKPKVNSDLYEIRCMDGIYNSMHMRGFDIKYLNINEGKGPREIKEDELPIDGVIVKHYGFEDTVNNDDGSEQRASHYSSLLTYVMDM